MERPTDNQRDDHPARDDRNDELEESPVPDPEETRATQRTCPAVTSRRTPSRARARCGPRPAPPAPRRRGTRPCATLRTARSFHVYGSTVTRDQPRRPGGDAQASAPHRGPGLGRARLGRGTCPARLRSPGMVVPPRLQVPDGLAVGLDDQRVDVRPRRAARASPRACTSRRPSSGRPPGRDPRHEQIGVVVGRRPDDRQLSPYRNSHITTLSSLLPPADA